MDFQSAKSFRKLRLRAFQPSHQILSMSEVSKGAQITNGCNAYACRRCLLNIEHVVLALNETNTDVHMYIEEFILVEIWIHCCTKLKWFGMEITVVYMSRLSFFIHAEACKIIKGLVWMIFSLFDCSGGFNQIANKGKSSGVNMPATPWDYHEKQIITSQINYVKKNMILMALKY